MKYDLNKPMLGKPAVRRWPHGLVGGVLACAFGLVLGCGASRPLRQSFDAAMADQRADAVLQEDSFQDGFNDGLNDGVDQPNTDGNELSPCLSASECHSMACDPTTMACAARCHFGGTGGPAVCGPGFSCMPEQPLGAAIGACFKNCKMNGDCPAGQQCSPEARFSFGSAAAHVCIRFGSKPRGETCVSTDLGSDCASGLVCAAGGHCRLRCDLSSQDPGCPASEICSLIEDYAGDATCSPSTGNPAALGEPCTQQEGTECGNDGKALRGFCNNAVCLRRCQEGTACGH